VTKILANLRSQNVVEEDGVGLSTFEGGKPPKLYTFNSRAKSLIGMHISGETLFGKLVDLNINPIAEVSVHIPRETVDQELLDSVESAIRNLLSDGDVAWSHLLGIAIGTPGVTDLFRGSVIHSPHNPSWGHDFHLRDLVQERIGESCKVFVDNAIRFRTIAERDLGLLQGAKDGIVVHCDEGLIAGVLLDGVIRRGFNNLAGSVGHMTVNPADTAQCDCGGYGCFEMQVKPGRVLERFVQRLNIERNSEFSSRPPSSITIEDLFAAAEDGNPGARHVMREVAQWFAVGLHNLILAYDPEIVVIQGKYADAGAYFRSELIQQVEKVSLVQAPLKTRVVCSSLGEDAASLGAASYVLSKAFV
jgi:predicted NBD/HSP70 family sugar kinase